MRVGPTRFVISLTTPSSKGCFTGLFETEIGLRDGFEVVIITVETSCCSAGDHTTIRFLLPYVDFPHTVYTARTDRLSRTGT
jgi:hypothetical protein